MPLAFALILICSTSDLQSQERKINFDHLTINEGLSQNTVFCILQDRQGFIWIGTEDGLNKFNGYEFTIYKHENNNLQSLSHSQINALLEDTQGNIWVGTADGLNQLNRNKDNFIRYPKLSASTTSNTFVTSLLEDHEGNIWVGTFEGLSLYDTQKETFFHYSMASPLPDQVMTNNSIQALFEDRNHLIWVGVGNDLKRFDPERKEFLPLPTILKENTRLRKSHIRVIRQDSKGNFWFGTENAGLFYYDVKNNLCKNYVHDATKNSLPSNMVREVFIASKNEVWIGTREGLSILNINKGHFINYRYNKHDQKGLSHNSVRNIMRDNAGSIWVGTFAGGINIYHQSSNNFSHIKEQIGNRTGVSHRVISSIIEDENGVLWVGTEGGGLNYLDREAGQHIYYTTKNTHGKLPSNNIKSLAKDSAGNLWIGTYDGLSFYNKVEKTFHKIYPKNGKNTLSNNQIYCLSIAQKGLWIGTNGGGLNYLSKNGQLETFVHDPTNRYSISDNNIVTLLDENDDYLWVGTEQGLNLYNKRQKKFIRFLHLPQNPYSISNNSILALFKDSHKQIWIGTEGGGLNLYDRAAKRFYAITEADGLSNNVVHAIQEDNEGNLWVSTNKGLSEIILGSTALPFKRSAIRINNYTIADGLQSNQFLTGSVSKGKSGELFFGGINGITTFFPEQIIRNTMKPKIVLTDFLIYNRTVAFGENSPLSKPIMETDSITLTYDQAFITFKFAALNFINPDNNRYAYKMEGFSKNDQWNFVGRQRSATYTNLEAGEYIFKVKAANNDGIWNENPAEVYIKVLPPYWKTWWAYTLYAFFIAFLLFLFYHFSLKNAKLKNRLLFEHMAHENEQELNQRKLRFFTNISHEIKTPLTLILSPLEKLIRMNEGNNKVHNQLMLMQRNGERLIRLINQLLDFRKFETGSMQLNAAEGDIVKFSKEVFIAFEVYTQQRNVSIKFSSAEDEIKVWFDRDKLEKILYNLLSNAIKFTPEGGQIALNIKTEKKADALKGSAQRYVILEVEDNGIGISSENIENIFERYNHFDDPKSNINGTGIGLAFTKGLVELHSGEITVESRRATTGLYGYTCFTLKLPFGHQHLNADQIIRDFKDSEHIQGYRQEEFPVVSQAVQKKRLAFQEAGKERPIMLVVEDNVEVLQFIADNFAEAFEVHTASDGAQGLEVAVEAVPDIIISDVMMPRMNGISFCSKIKKDHRTSHIPIILLTARTPLIFKIEGLETGADDYITKPFSLHFLEARVWNLLESRQKLRERYRKDVFLQPKNVALTSPDEKFLEKAMRFMEENIAEPSLNVEELGKEVGMSRITLYRKIKALTNQTAVEFIRNFRLKRAAQLLEQDKLQVNEVAYMVGFQDIDYFRKCFKEQFGHTPKEYAHVNPKQ